MDTEDRLVVARGSNWGCGAEVEEMGELFCFGFLV